MDNLSRHTACPRSKTSRSMRPSLLRCRAAFPSSTFNGKERRTAEKAAIKAAKKTNKKVATKKAAKKIVARNAARKRAAKKGRA